MNKQRKLKSNGKSTCMIDYMWDRGFRTYVYDKLSLRSWRAGFVSGRAAAEPPNSLAGFPRGNSRASPILSRLRHSRSLTASQPKQKHSRAKSRQLRRLKFSMKHQMGGLKLASFFLNKQRKLKSNGKSTCMIDYMWDRGFRIWDI